MNIYSLETFNTYGIELNNLTDTNNFHTLRSVSMKEDPNHILNKIELIKDKGLWTSDKIYNSSDSVLNYSQELISELLSIYSPQDGIKGIFSEDYLRFFKEYGFYVRLPYDDYKDFETEQILQMTGIIYHLIVGIDAVFDKSSDENNLLIKECGKFLMTHKRVVLDAEFSQGEIGSHYFVYDISNLQSFNFGNDAFSNKNNFIALYCHIINHIVMRFIPSDRKWFENSDGFKLTFIKRRDPIPNLISFIFYYLYSYDPSLQSHVRCKNPNCNRFMLRNRTNTKRQYCCRAHAQQIANRTFRLGKKK